MGEIIGGAIVIGLFIAFVVWRNKNKPASRRKYDHFEQQFWTEREAEKPVIVPAEADDGDDDSGDDGD
jgi:hypothetical protein